MKKIFYCEHQELQGVWHFFHSTAIYYQEYANISHLQIPKCGHLLSIQFNVTVNW